jgi:uncharacterized protein (TIGR02231 family)
MSELDTSISAVTVYTDRARITRVGTLTLQPGQHRLEISELPLGLDPASLRASARGSARARLLGVDARRDFYDAPPAARVQELEAQIEKLGDEKRELDLQTELFKRERDVLGELAGQTETYARGLAYGKTSAETHIDLLDSLRGRAQALNTDLLDLAVRQRDLARRQERLQRELDQLRGSRGRERYTASVEVEVLQAGELTLELLYVVSDARWQPLYDVRLWEEQEPATLEVSYLAQVTQRSGEDWIDAALTLSTARPALAETAPELAPWYIGPVPVPRPTARAKAAPAPAALATVAFRDAAPVAGEAEELVLEAEPVMAEVRTTGAAVTYQVPGTATIPADGTPHKVTVARLELQPKSDYVTAPKLVQAAYRRARTPNASPYTLLPGPANLFVGDEFIGATELDLIAPQEEIELYLGADDRVKVEYELKRRDVDKRLIGDKRRLRYGYEVRLENLLPDETKITLHDHIPVPRHEDIKVKLESAQPEPTQKTELALLDWELTLPPGEKQTVRFDFVVEHPRGMKLTGLP